MVVKGSLGKIKFNFDACPLMSFIYSPYIPLDLGCAALIKSLHAQCDD